MSVLKGCSRLTVQRWKGAVVGLVALMVLLLPGHKGITYRLKMHRIRGSPGARRKIRSASPQPEIRGRTIHTAEVGLIRVCYRPHGRVLVIRVDSPSKSTMVEPHVEVPLASPSRYSARRRRRLREPVVRRLAVEGFHGLNDPPG